MHVWCVFTSWCCHQRRCENSMTMSLTCFVRGSSTSTRYSQHLSWKDHCEYVVEETLHSCVSSQSMLNLWIYTTARLLSRCQSPEIVNKFAVTIKSLETSTCYKSSCLFEIALAVPWSCDNSIYDYCMLSFRIQIPEWRMHHRRLLLIFLKCYILQGWVQVHVKVHCQSGWLLPALLTEGNIFTHNSCSSIKTYWKQ